MEILSTIFIDLEESDNNYDEIRIIDKKFCLIYPDYYLIVEEDSSLTKIHKKVTNYNILTSLLNENYGENFITYNKERKLLKVNGKKVKLSDIINTEFIINVVLEFDCVYFLLKIEDDYKMIIANLHNIIASLLFNNGESSNDDNSNDNSNDNSANNITLSKDEFQTISVNSLIKEKHCNTEFLVINQIIVFFNFSTSKFYTLVNTIRENDIKTQIINTNYDNTKLKYCNIYSNKNCSINYISHVLCFVDRIIIFKFI